VKWLRALGMLGVTRGALGQTLGFASAGSGGTGLTWPPEQPFLRVLDRARALDSTAISQLYARFLPIVYRFVLARVGDVHTAEDLTSDTFFVMVEQMGSTRAQDELSFAAWLLGIARNKVLMHHRRRRTGPAFAPELAEDAHPSAAAEQDDPLTIITARESWSEVVAALNKLTEEQRTVVLYRCVLGYSTDEVAALMERKPGTIRALQFRALASLARLLKLDEAPRAPNGAMVKRDSRLRR